MKRKNIFKSLLAAAMALIMIFGAAPLSGFVGIRLPVLSLKAEAATTEDGLFEYEVEKKWTGSEYEYGVRIISYKGPDSGEVVIPKTIEGYEVKWIGDRYFYGAMFFQDRAGITSVVIPSSVISIGESIFSGCTSLAKITVSPDNKNYSSVDGVLFNKDMTILIRYPEGAADSSYVVPNSVVEIYSNAFIGCNSIKSITLSKGLKKIYDGTFANLTNLESVIVQEGVQHIGNKAFENCSSLKQISLPESLISIGSVYKGNPNDFSASEYFQYGRTFYGCTSLEEVKIPDNVEIIGYSTFYGCTSLSKVKLSKKLKEIAENTFYGCSSLKNIIIPKGVLEIGYSAFENCTSLENIELPDGLTAIGISVDHYFHTSGCYSFAGCTSLKEVVIPDSVTGIGSRAFSGCTSLSKVKLSNNLAIIDEGTFSGCTSLAEIVIPDSVTKIRGKSDSEYFGGAFIGCTSLSKVKLSNNLTEIGIYTFLGCTSLAEIDMPDSVTEIDWSAFKDCTSLSKVKLSNNLTKIENRVFSGCTSLKEIAIPDGVTEIDYSAFSGCTSLQEITIPDSVTTVYDTAFSNCTSLESITIGSGVENLGNGWIDSCRRLANIIVSPENKTYSSVDGVLFNKDKSELLAYPIGNKRSSYTIPDGVTKIDQKAFYGCRYIETLTIPASVKEIEDSALGNCYDIRTINYLGTREQWKEVIIGADNYMFALVNVRCADDPPCNHSWSAWEVVEEATYEKEGIERRSCSLCNIEETRSIPKLVRVSAIELSESEKTVFVGDTFTITATAKPEDAFNRTVTWSSSDPSIATVDENGTVTAIAEGEAIITAESADGVTAECKVTVEKKESFGKKLLNVITAPFRAIINLLKKLFGK
ncbi:MAG: leucine-rich repeat protein [Oscillospiraceae bacterium]|nr:leucine-rich repeat protein [Oscillospiraceae bacterium]